MDAWVWSELHSQPAKPVVQQNPLKYTPHRKQVSHNIFSKKEASPAGIHGFVVVHPLILSTLAVKGALLQAKQLESEAGPQLLQASYHPP